MRSMVRPELLSREDEERLVEFLRNTEKGLQMESEQLDVSIRGAAERLDASVRQRMAEPGKLGLPPLLEYRRLSRGIPDGAFRNTAAFERILVWQLPTFDDSGLWGSGILHKPDTVRDRDRHTAPRGIVLSAGLAALDQLRSNGIDLGHVILFAGLSPYEVACEFVDGHEMRTTILHSGDIFGSEDTQKLIDLGLLSRTCCQLEDGTIAHTFETAGGCSAAPTVPRNGYDG